MVRPEPTHFVVVPDLTWAFQIETEAKTWS